MTLDYLHQRLCSLAKLHLDGKAKQFVRLTAALDAMSPLKVLGRGYAVVRAGRRVIKSVQDICVGEPISIRLADGAISATVIERQEEPQ